MKRAGLDLLHTAVLGPVGRGTSGIVSLCAECRWAQLQLGPCGGFGEGCLVQRREPQAEPPTQPD